MPLFFCGSLSLRGAESREDSAGDAPHVERDSVHAAFVDHSANKRPR